MLPRGWDTETRAGGRSVCLEDTRDHESYNGISSTFLFLRTDKAPLHWRSQLVNNEALGFFLFCFRSDVFLIGFSWAARPWLPNFCLKSHQFVSSLFNVEILANLLSLRRFIADIRDAANEPCEPARSVIAWESSDEESSTHPHTPPLISTVTIWWILQKGRQHNYSHFWIQVFALTHGHKGRRSVGQPICSLQLILLPKISRE